jgi:hypothetical protein
VNRQSVWSSAELAARLPLTCRLLADGRPRFGGHRWWRNAEPILITKPLTWLALGPDGETGYAMRSNLGPSPPYWPKASGFTPPS